MPKGIIWFLILPGIFFFLIGVAAATVGVGGGGSIVFGLLLLAAGVAVAAHKVQTLTADQVVESWSTLIENGQENEQEVLEETQGYIEASKVPDVRINRQKIAPSFVSGLGGRTRDFLVITEHGNPRLGPYKMFLNARAYGNNLDVNWYLTYIPSLWQAILSLIPFAVAVQEAARELDLFDQQDLRAYSTNAHRCMLKAVDALMLSLAQDPNKIERRSRGFLGIS